MNSTEKLFNTLSSKQVQQSVRDSETFVCIAAAPLDLCFLLSSKHNLSIRDSYWTFLFDFVSFYIRYWSS